MNSTFFTKTVESSSRLVHVVKTEWGVDANSAKGEFKQTPQRGGSSRLHRGGVRVNSAFFKKTVESSSRLVHVVKTEWELM